MARARPRNSCAMRCPRRTPTLGICLGHQLAAVALGGAAEPEPARSAARPAAAGLDRRGGTATTWCATCVRRRVGVHWNDDIVTELPTGHRGAGADRPGRGPGGPVRADGVGRAAPPGGGRADPRGAGPSRGSATATPRECWTTSSRQIAAARAELEAGWRPLVQALAVVSATRRPRLTPWASRKTSFSAHSKSATSGSCGCGSPTCSATSSRSRSHRRSSRAPSPRASASTARRSRASPG